jgi:TRAP-type mannitol/chloroaromatic compound transport system substrate-binding protein
MQRRAFLMRAGAGVAASAIASPAIAQTGAPVRWRLATSWPKSLDTLYGSVDAMCQRVGQLTDRKFQIQCFAGGEIVPPLQVWDATQNGTVECGHTLTSFNIGKNPAVAFDSGLAFGLNTRQQQAWMNYGGGLELIRALFKKDGILPIPCGNVGVQMGGFYRKEINSVDDLKGLKFRIGGLGGMILTKLGVVPLQIPTADIYPSLERGTIDAAEWIGPYDDEKLGFQKVAPYYYYPGFWEGGLTLHFYFNKAKWESLPKNYQAIVEAACMAANLDMLAKYDAKNPAALRSLVGAGAQLRPFSPEILDAAYKATNEVYAEISAQNADFKKMIDSIRAFRNEEYLWFQVAEYAFDTYMIRARTRG